jgi:hypothetical protein
MIIEQKSTVVEFGLGETKEVKIIDFFNHVQEMGGTFEILTPNGFQRIGELYNKKGKKIFTLELSDGKKLTGSEDHLVLLDTTQNEDNEINENIEILDGDTWIRLKNIKNSDWVRTADGSVKVSSCNFEDIGETYDLEVLSESHSYLSNGIVSHNTGKSSIADGIALRIIQRKCSRNLYNKRIVMLDLASLVSGTKYRGQFEERLKAVMAELEKQPDVILFLDEIHTIIGAGGSSGSLDAANIMKPALARGEIQCIGATTFDEFKKHIEKDSALVRRFQKVILKEPTMAETVEILKNLKESYETFHRVFYEENVIETINTTFDTFKPRKTFELIKTQKLERKSIKHKLVY